jgi:MFS transporter, AAHS family, 4-hydroxybenzoate transporter
LRSGRRDRRFRCGCRWLHAPALRTVWTLTPAQLAPLFGLMIGAFFFGPIADKVGRKKILVLTTAFFGITTIASSFAPSIGMLTILRFVTGLGLGGAMPAAITLISEFCPEATRSSLVTLMFCGFAIGSAAAGFATSHIVAACGWQGLLVMGGVLLLLLAPAPAALVPESVRYLTRKGEHPERIAAALQHVAPEADLTNATFTGVRKAHGSPVAQIFSDGLAAVTLLLWVAFFMSLLVFYLLSSWLPLLIPTAGFSIGQASSMAATLAAGGTVGAIVIGLLMDRFNPHTVLGGLRRGRSLRDPAGQLDFGALASDRGHLRFGIWRRRCAGRVEGPFHRQLSDREPSDWVSWANAVGRIGAVLGPMTGGFLLSVG